MTCAQPRFRTCRALILLSVAGPAGAAWLLGALDQNPALAVHATAPPPFGVFHDLRWLLAFHPGWLGFALEAVAALVVRTVFIATAVKLAWPASETAPSWRRALGQAGLFTVSAWVLLTLFAAIMFGMAVTPVSWLFFAGVTPVLVLGVFLHQAAIPGRPWSHPTWRTAGWTVLSFFVLTAGGTAVTIAPRLWLAVTAAGLAGVFNAWAWFGITHESACKVEPRWRVPLAPIAVGGLFVIFIGLSALLLDVITRPTGPTAPVVAEERGSVPVLVAGGFSSRWDGEQHSLLAPPFAEQQFSYRGLGPDGEPLAYDAEATYASLAVLAARMERQVTALAARFGRPVDVIAQSEGSLVAALYAVQAGDELDDLLLLSPLLEPARVHYPEPDEDGWGVAGGWTLRGVVGLIARISPYNADPDHPFIRSLVEHAPTFRRLAPCVLARDGAYALLPVADGLASPLPEREVEVQAVPAWHAGFLSGEDPAPLIRAALLDRPLPVDTRWSTITLLASAVSAGWHVPTVPLTVPRAWQDNPVPAVGAACEDVEEWAERWIDEDAGR